ncbi:MAG: nickel pincer cofactor biosynthesis protein LarB [Actinomycetota bacterium]
MDETTLRAVLRRYSDGELSDDEAVRELRYLPYADLGFARVDHHRELRLGLPEAVFGPGKSPEQVAAIVSSLLAGNQGAVIVTRATKAQYEAVAAVASEAVFDDASRLIVARPQPPSGGPTVVVASAGTADLAVAEESAATLEALGVTVTRLYDVGVAGLHRLLAARDVLDGAAVVIGEAGMDGALASVIGGLVAAPVVAVPTSVGYGAGAAGIAPLLTMLNACAPGVVVVNIDNGFGAAVFAAMLVRRPPGRPGAEAGGAGAPGLGPGRARAPGTVEPGTVEP